MISLDHTQILTIQIEGLDIQYFVDVVKKLLATSTQAGFKKSFTLEEREFIKELAANMGMEETQDFSESKKE